MVRISGCGSENTFWLSQTFSIWPAAISSPLSPPSLCFSYAFVSKHKRFIAHMLAFVVHILCICIACQCVWSKYTLVCIYMSPHMSLSVHLFAFKLGCKGTFVYTKKKPGYSLYACTVSDDVHACNDMSGGLGLPWCDQAGARGVSGSHGPMGSW